MTTDTLENALAFADSDIHDGNHRVLFAQAKAASRTLASEVRRLSHELGVTSQNYIHACERADRKDRVIAEKNAELRKFYGKA